MGRPQVGIGDLTPIGPMGESRYVPHVTHDDEIDISELVDGDAGRTEQLSRLAAPRQQVQRFRLTCSEGTDSGKSWQSQGLRFSIGSHPSNDLVVEDNTVSRFHCELRVDARGVWCHDLDSRNGTLLDGVPVGVGGLREGSTIRCGRTVLTFNLQADQASLPLSEQTNFGGMVGASVAMRAVFALLQRAAQSDATVLIEGETGTGKEGAAESVHLHSKRRDGPFIVVDCGAMPGNLLESELFGHERGAFTGAHAQRIGAFEEASGGTIFLDEIGELPSDLQPKLLRVLEQKQVRRVGSNRHQTADVRVVAATNRDLRARVNDGGFRSDLYYRLAVVTVPLPPLRERLDDIPLLVDHFRGQLAVSDADAEQLFTPEFILRLQRSAWPGNVRELRNFLERCVVMQQSLPLEASAPSHSSASLNVDPRLSYSEAKRSVLDRFEHDYLDAVLRLHDGNVSAAARSAGMDRPYMYKLLHRHGLRSRKQ